MCLESASFTYFSINASNSSSQGCPNIFYDPAQRSERVGQFITLTEKNENQEGGGGEIKEVRSHCEGL